MKAGKRLRKFEKLMSELQNEEVKKYYVILNKKKLNLIAKRVLDFFIAFVLTIFLIIPMLIIACLIKIDSKGPVFFKQERVTKYGTKFKILKFRSMYIDSEQKGLQVTVGEDPRITKMGRRLRKLRLDELPQIFHVLSGKMSFVGTRPEVTSYVECYSNEMYATLLMPAGITSLASIKYKDEDELLQKAKDPNSEYINVILPEKMKYNLEYIQNFSVLLDFKLLFKTAFAVLK